MPVPYGEVVRRSVLEAVERGMSYSQAAAHLRVSRRWIGTIVRRYRGTGSLAAQPNARTPILGPREEQTISAWLTEDRTLTLAKLASRLGGEGVSVSLFTVARALKRMGWRRLRSGWEPPYGAETGEHAVGTGEHAVGTGEHAVGTGEHLQAAG